MAFRSATPPPRLPGAFGQLYAWLRDLYVIVNSILSGKINSVGSITLTINVATSTLTNAFISSDSTITLTPTTANAAAEVGNGTIYVSARTNGSATITHANNAQADRTFLYAVLG